MTPPVVLAVTEGPAAYAGLAGALAEQGERLGWLELGAAVEPSAPGLEAAAAIGVLRAVGVGVRRVATVKPVRGEPVLDDLLREHFRGCLLVLARGVEGRARLAPAGSGWRLIAPGAAPVERSTAELIADLRRPSRWR